VQYLLMIYRNEAEDSPPDSDERAASLAEYDRFNATFGARGILRGGAQLQSSETATSVRVRDGEVMLTDGPFAETREQLGGYYVIDCATLDDALEVAAAIPGARYGTVEVRPQVGG